MKYSIEDSHGLIENIVHAIYQANYTCATICFHASSVFVHPSIYERAREEAVEVFGKLGIITSSCEPMLINGLPVKRSMDVEKSHIVITIEQKIPYEG